MNIKNVNISNFRCFENAFIGFNSNMNVITGSSGSGKSALLDAIAIGLSRFLSNIHHVSTTLHDYDAYMIPKEIKDPETGYTIIGQQMNFPIVITCNVNEPNLSWTIKKTSTRKNSITFNYDTITDYVVDWHRKMTMSKTFEMPVIAYYGANRFWSYNYSSTTCDPFDKRFSGYTDCIKKNNVNEKELSTYFHSMNYYESNKLKSFPQFYAVLDAISKCFADLHEDVKDVSTYCNATSNKFEIKYTDKDGNLHVCPFYRLGDGDRNTISLVADIARRMAILNPHLGTEVLKKTSGVVLIDEVELHLHPKAQRNILNVLSTIFPQVQFIVTTNSPIVISSMKEGIVFTIGEYEIVSRGTSLYGQDANTILSTILDAAERPKEVMDLFDEFHSLLDDGRWKKAQNKLDELTEILGSDDHGVVEASVSLDFWKNNTKSINETLYGRKK